MIPRCMSTQHPDNVNIPFFSDNPELDGELEILEAFYSFSHLDVDEQMWDNEGKEVDNYVVKKLLIKYSSYFSKYKLGRDKFLTLRIPNPSVEKNEAKLLLETLESIPRSFDVAKLFYNENVIPIFEVILPMTASSNCLDRVYYYYKDFVIGKKNKMVMPNDIKIAEWIGDFFPDKINVIPLFEDMEHMMNADSITRQYLQTKNVDYQRVFIARSDPAAYYGNISAILLNKIALYRLYKLSKEINIDIYPIIGVGSAPFRGNLKPSTVKNVLAEYPSVYTFTIQSSFKYDNNPDEVKEGIKILKSSQPSAPHEFDIERSVEIINKLKNEYQRQIEVLAPIINKVAKYIPSRRKRKLHTGLFGYSRNISGISMPRAITFTASLYSIGVPPEILGINALNTDDIKFLKSVYVNFEKDLMDAAQFLDIDNKYLPDEVRKKLDQLSIDVNFDKNHISLTQEINKRLENNHLTDLNELIVNAANIRKFLG